LPLRVITVWVTCTVTELGAASLALGVPDSTPAEDSFSPFGRVTFFHFSMVVWGLEPDPLARKPTLARTLRSTNAVESMIEICRDHSRNVKRWRGGEMVLRWCAAGMVEAKKQFRRVNGHLHLRSLRAALEQHVQETVTPPRYTPEKEVAA
jgi:hypothetical protein